MKTFVNILLILFVSSLFNCTKTKESMKINVELDVFSGRPNPSWVLEKEDAEDMSKMLQNLPTSQKNTPIGDLGYRGFIVTTNEKQTFRIYEAVVYKETEPKEILLDENNLEQLLINMAQEKGYGGILKSLGVK
jgi:hypothetical protein